MANIAMLERHLLTLYSSGCYISNFDLLHIAKECGIHIDLSDRVKMLKKLLAQAKEEQKTEKLLRSFIHLYQKRIQEYQRLYERTPIPPLQEHLQKATATIRLLQISIQKECYGSDL